MGSAFVLARQQKHPVGCGAIRRLRGNVAEVRRIFVQPEARGLGIGARILAELEIVARVLGYTRMRLATGLRQPAAIRLYEKAGYQRIALYGRYRGNPFIVCFQKSLEPTGAYGGKL